LTVKAAAINTAVEAAASLQHKVRTGMRKHTKERAYVHINYNNNNNNNNNNCLTWFNCEL
jgi:hypothetical protein